MEIAASALIGLGTGLGVWRFMRYKNGESVFPTYDEYATYKVPIVIHHDGSKPQLPWNATPYSETLDEIQHCVKTGKKFEGCDIRRFYLSKLSDKDAMLYGQAVHEAHLHTRHGKRCKIYLKGDKFVLEVTSAIK